jgi:hypothetical protein
LQQNKLHIVSFDVPYPADYGGAIDVYYKIKALHDAGVEIYLHCFDYGRGDQPQLKELCHEVWYYPRNTGIKGVSFNKPYIVNSRKNALLLKRLQDIEAPILFEGVHTTYYLNHPSLKTRKKAVRVHNVESDYYRQLATKENSLVKKSYYSIESSLLEHYERTLINADTIFALSMDDEKHFASLYPNTKHQFIGPFHYNNQITSIPGTGNYCLYHGNLSHPENIEAALFLLKEVIPNIESPFIIAGRNPTTAIINACNTVNNCQLVANPNETQMHQLMQDAHIHLMISFMASGMKLKLLNALYQGRHVIANDPILYGTGLDQLCYIAKRPIEILAEISHTMNEPFTEKNIANRNTVLSEHYNNQINAHKIITWMQE